MTTRKTMILGSTVALLSLTPLEPPRAHAQDAPEPEPRELEPDRTDDDASADDDDTSANDDASTDDDEDDDEDDAASMHVGDEVVTGHAEEQFHTGGSAHSIGEETLEQLDYDDPNSILVSVPGVYVRQEDGYGLRPNIGIRGANAERSRRITLMEDGVLLAPAPYSAPAAYYFPLVTRMTGVDVFMGPAAIPYGPHTVGGAIDFRDRPIPATHEGGLDLALGSTWFGRFHGHYGDSNEWGGFLVEAVHLRTDGFRTLDFGEANTGFDRSDIVARGELHGDLNADVYHRLEIVAGLGLEHSNDSYLGLTLEDLRESPWRRYGIAGTDRMDWWRTRVMARYELLSDPFDLLVTAYRHDFDRTYQRIDSFVDGTPLGAVLQDPTSGRNAVYFGVLTGAEQASTPGQAVLRAVNHRVFVSQGVQARARFRAQTDEVRHTIEVGLRLHYDEIARHHTGVGVLIDGSSLVEDGRGERLLLQNRAQSIAFSAYGAYQIRWRALTVTPGIRLESVWSEMLDLTTGRFQITQQAELLPGFGATYEIIPDLAAFAGVHRGYSPVAPGQPEGVRPEQSWNYEIGMRYGRIDTPTHGQLAYFLSDYENLTGECSGAGGCPEELVDRMFNGDRATVMGIEAEATHTFVIDDLHIPLRGNYTYTYTRFATAFISESPTFGTVRIGDHLPYVPEHQFTLGAGFDWRFLRANLQATYVGVMRDQASQGPILAGQGTDEQFYLDAMASVEVYPGIRLYVRGENLTNSAPIVSYRPFGARTGRTLLVQGGLEATF